jgi:hypothetical protein
MPAPAKKSKKFRIFTEGATVDGRVVERAWIRDMAATYDPAKYRAGINIEHIRSALPDSPFKNYGFVDALDATENATGKLELFATITPSDDLVKLVGSMQKVFTSAEVSPKFADTGRAYLVGLAVTDTPASLGTEMLKFTAQHPESSPLTARKQHPDNVFGEATETVIEFTSGEPAKPSVLAKVREMFRRKDASDDARFTDLAAAIEEVAEHGETQSTQTAQKFQTVDATVAEHKQRVDELTQRLDAVEQKFHTTPMPAANRPQANGSGLVLTEF